MVIMRMKLPSFPTKVQPVFLEGVFFRVTLLVVGLGWWFGGIPFLLYILIFEHVVFGWWISEMFLPEKFG